MRLLKVVAANFRAGNVCRDRQDRCAVPVAIKKSVDQVKIARPAAACAYGQLAGQMSLSSGSKRRRLFIAHVYPVNRLGFTQRIGKTIQRIANNAVNPLHVGRKQRFNHYLGDFLCHDLPPLLKNARRGARPDGKFAEPKEPQ